MVDLEHSKPLYDSRPVYIWGTGQAGKNLFTKLKDIVEVNGFIDSDSTKWGTKVEGRIIFSPDTLVEQKNTLKPYIFIGSMYKDEIAKRLETMGYEKTTDYYEIKYNYKEIHILEDNNSHSLVLRHVKPKTCILEFGPYDGHMTRYLKEKLGCSIWAVEADWYAAKIVESYCEKLIIDDIDSLEWTKTLAGETFDHILFIDVLEHLRNPEQVLQSAKNFLKEDGTILISIPNISHNAIIMELLNGDFNYQLQGLLDDTHIRFFTKKSISTLLGKIGLKAIEWMNVVKEPYKTEFKQNYSSFPKPIQEYLLAREDGHVYQYIIVIKKQ